MTETAEPAVAAPMPDAWRAEEAERAVLGAVMIDPRAIELICTRLSPHDFLDETLGKLYRLFLDMAANGEPVGDATILCSKIRATKLLEKLGGVAGIARLQFDCMHPQHAPGYAAEIRKAAERRRLADLASRFYDSLIDSDTDPQDAVATLESQFAVSGFQQGSEAIHIADASTQQIEKIRKAQQSKYKVGVQTGLMVVDNFCNGLFPEELTVLAARPSIGKSALASQIAYNAALQNRPSLFVSLEMAEWELAGRVLAAESGIEARSIRSASVTPDEIERLESVRDSHRDLPLWFWRPQRATVAQIRAKARETHTLHGLAMVVVDYLQLVKAEDPRMFRRDQLSQIGKDLKELANELQIPVLALSQLNREGEGNKPSLSQLSESGTIEQDANAVWLLHRADRAAEDAVLMIEKNRGGTTGEIQLKYDGSKTLFFDPSETDFY